MMQRLDAVAGTTQRVTILDGGSCRGTGRELKKIGAPFRQPEWSALSLMEAPECVTRVHERYIAAGADVITANSYAVVPFHIGADRFASDGERLAALSGQLARSAAAAVSSSRHVRVAASLPPVCGSYRSDLFNAAEAAPVLRLLILALVPFADLWLAETLSAIEEAELVVAELAAAHATAPLWLSFTLAEDGGAEPRLRSGELVSTAAIAASRLGAKALLFNCSQPEVMAAAVSVAAVALSGGGIFDVEIGCYANAFAPQTADAEANAGLSELREDVTPAGYRTFAEEWVSRGATIVGGCCGIGPEHIAYLTASKAPE